MLSVTKRAYDDAFDVRLRAKALPHCCVAKAGIYDAWECSKIRFAEAWMNSK